MKFTVPKSKHEIFVRIDMKHSYILLKLFHDLFAIVVEIKIELLVVCQKLIHGMLLLLYEVINLTLYMYLFIEIS